MGFIFGFLRDFFLETVRMLYESGLFLLFGFFIAGLLHAYLSTDRIVSFLGKRDFRSMLNAAILGAPLPLCSCGVLPAAVALRRKGASREATLSFLISTPETSFESIALSYGLLGPVYAVVRPLVALITALVAGTAHILFGDDEEGEGEVEGGAGVECAPSELTALKAVPTLEGQGRFRSALHYAFHYMFDQLVFWFLLGILLTGFLGALLPSDFFARYLGSGIFSIVVAILVGIPLYMCASGSTPIAAALLVKGLSPGAALAFLLTGPVTNVVTLSVLGKVFGRRFLKIMIVSIMATALVAGLLLNRLYMWSSAHVPGYTGSSVGFILSTLKGIGFLVFLFLAYRSIRRTGLHTGFNELSRNMATVFGSVRRFRITHIFTTGTGRITAAVLILIYLSSGLYTVAPGEVAMEQIFGKVLATGVPPGLHWCFPSPIGRVARCTTEGTVRIDIGFRSEEKVRDPLAYYSSSIDEPARSINRVFEESLFLTGDENIVDVMSTVHYRVIDPVKYTFGVESGENAVRDVVLWCLVRELAIRKIDRIITVARMEIEEAVVARSNRILEEGSTGLHIQEIRVLAAHAPREVHYDFRDVASAQEDRARMIHEARVYWYGAVNIAKGTAARIVADADGMRSGRVAAAEGSAARFRLLREAAKLEPRETRHRLYLETMERILPGCRTVIRPDPTDVKDFDLWFRSGSSAVLPGIDGKEKGGSYGP